MLNMFQAKKNHASKVPPIGQARGSVEVVCMEKAHGWPRCFDSEKSIDSCLVAVGKNKFFFFCYDLFLLDHRS